MPCSQLHKTVLYTKTWKIYQCGSSNRALDHTSSHSVFSNHGTPIFSGPDGSLSETVHLCLRWRDCLDQLSGSQDVCVVVLFSIQRPEGFAQLDQVCFNLIKY